MIDLSPVKTLKNISRARSFDATPALQRRCHKPGLGAVITLRCNTLFHRTTPSQNPENDVEVKCAETAALHTGAAMAQANLVENLPLCQPFDSLMRPTQIVACMLLYMASCL